MSSFWNSPAWTMGKRSKTGFILFIQLIRRRVILSLDPATIILQPTSASITPTGNAPENEQKVTALIVGTTLNAPSGTPVDGNTILFRIYSAAAQTLTWNAIYKPFFEALPTATVAGKELYLCFIYNGRSSKWDYVSKVVEI